MAEQSTISSTSGQGTPKFAIAKFIPVTGDNGKYLSKKSAEEKTVIVHFNPETLDISYNNTIKKGKKKPPAQIISDTTSKLSLELVFDTTTCTKGDGRTVEAGKDVRAETNKLAVMVNPQLLAPNAKAKMSQKISIVAFVWGPIKFQGYIDNYKEKLEYFSAEGIPLRATVSVSMTQQQPKIDDVSSTNAQGLSASGDSGTAQQVTQPGKKPITPADNNAVVKRVGLTDSLAATIQKFADPRDVARLALNNGIENLRYPGVEELVFSDMTSRATPNLVKQSTAKMLAAGEAQQGETEKLFARLQNQIDSNTSLTPRPNFSIEPLDFEEQIPGVGVATGFGIDGQVDPSSGGSIVADVGVDLDIEPGILFEE